MRIGFTGTQVGMTIHQRMVFMSLLVSKHPTEFHHGDCIGADAEAHDIAASINSITLANIFIHPPVIHFKRAWKKSAHIFPVLPYIQRNHNIVNQTDHLLAASKTMHETLRSGTWATVRYAQRQRKPVTIIFPDGTTSFRHGQ